MGIVVKHKKNTSHIVTVSYGCIVICWSY